MPIIVGIDVGGSTTKIVGFNGKTLLSPMYVKATDPIASIYGAFGKFANINKIALSSISRIMITGVGSTYIDNNIYGIPTEHVDEFAATGRGGLYLSGLDEAIVVSMGTGTAMIYSKDKEATYLGGTGIGGGTLLGLSKKILRMEDVEQIAAIAEEGNIENIDLKIKDITSKNIIPTLPKEATAANFGKISDIATNGDFALGIINLVFETIGMMAVFAARGKNLDKIVLTGNLSSFRQAARIYSDMGIMFDMDFIIPQNSSFATVIGTALLYLEES
ncbi:MAG: type II pantothenate kinase [Eubacteriales bacterium]|nr:type II pantothenate kinase [Eubacteriales bacterium]